ncbi:MAG: Ppx/GppA family phosphatase [Nitrospirae bacterium]|nr:Ppx/GppA family phosphatase [Nitrospirota bacterium]
MSILAGIDIGTNTVRLLIADVKDKYNFKEIRSERRITRLGEGLIENGRLMPSAEDRTIFVLKEFGEILKGYPVEAFTAVATSAVREAENGREFVERIKVETDFDIEIISGDEEARRTFLGVLAGLNPSPSSSPHWGEGRVRGKLLIMDIGGGSTEFIVSKEAEVLSSISTGLGVVKLTERFIKSDPVSDRELEGLRNAIDKEIKALKNILNSPANITFVGTAGTITTLAAIDQNLTLYNPLRINNYILKKKSVDRIFDNLKSMTIEERLNIPALEKGREDLIIAGTAIVLSVMEEFGFREMTVCDYGLREGIVIDLYNKKHGN